MPKFLRLSERFVNVLEITHYEPASPRGSLSREAVIYFTSGEKLLLSNADVTLFEAFLNTNQVP
jgi:hypothetical protein